ncbi:MAG: hypothetical protein K0S67_16 [Nitrososphaeraceae archaeon]|jgi:hypothetical protein|nr:hypothetical protein [Nitrososphaeraceae archaeon]
MNPIKQRYEDDFNKTIKIYDELEKEIDNIIIKDILDEKGRINNIIKCSIYYNELLDLFINNKRIYYYGILTGFYKHIEEITKKMKNIKDYYLLSKINYLLHFLDNKCNIIKGCTIMKWVNFDARIKNIVL